jgi:esterase/lipase superfamily enzyme
MRVRRVELYSPVIGAAGSVLCYGEWGRPVLAFPSEQGRAEDFANNGMVATAEGLIAAGRVKIYSVDSYDSVSWAARDVPLEERARRHGAYESWIADQVAPFIHEDCGGRENTGDIVTVGCSMGAFHALNFAFHRADLFPQAFGMSGNYDPSAWDVWGERGDAAYFTNPTDYVAHLHGDHLDWLRSRLWILLVCGQGQWEDTTGSLDSTRLMAGLLASKGIPHELDLWGHDVPHDWPSWRAQFAHHLPRFC